MLKYTCGCFEQSKVLKALSCLLVAGPRAAAADGVPAGGSAGRDALWLRPQRPHPHLQVRNIPPGIISGVLTSQSVCGRLYASAVFTLSGIGAADFTGEADTLCRVAIEQIDAVVDRSSCGRLERSDSSGTEVKTSLNTCLASCLVQRSAYGMASEAL